MSLINDALKRAKAAQQTAPKQEACAIPFKPVEAGRVPEKSRAVALPAALLALTIVALFSVWFGLRKSNATTHAASTVTVPAAAQQRPQTSSPQTPNATREVPVEASANAAVSPAVERQRAAATVSPGPVSPVTREATTIPPPQTLPAGSAIAAPAPAVESAPSRPPLRLQAIFYNPARPSAMIGGKTLFIGDTVGEFRIEAIAAESATLVNAGQTNILTVAR